MTPLTQYIRIYFSIFLSLGSQSKEGSQGVNLKSGREIEIVPFFGVDLKKEIFSERSVCEFCIIKNVDTYIYYNTEMFEY